MVENRETLLQDDRLKLFYDTLLMFSPDLEKVMKMIPMKLIKTFASIYQILCDIIGNTEGMDTFVLKYEEMVQALISMKVEITNIDSNWGKMLAYERSHLEATVSILHVIQG